MDYQTIVDGFSAMACIVSVEKNAEGSQRKFRIVTGNKAYIDSIEHPSPMARMLTDKFTPNTEYTNYITRDLNFETYCYQAAVDHKCLHSYAHPDRMDFWFNMSFLPLESDDENLAYCIYIMELEFEASSERMSGISDDIAASVLDTCIKLRGTNNFKATMQEVIKDIRDLCDAEHCCILSMDEMNRKCAVLGEALSKDTKLLPMDTYVNDAFYDIAESWIGTIAGSNCLIAKDENDMLLVKERNPVWYDSLTTAGARNIVLFPLKSRNQLLGFMWAINYDSSRSTKIKETLEVTTFILGSELGNYLLLDRLRTLGSKDLLTGVMNRNEMNNYVESLSRGEKQGNSSVAVLFADLNGLKDVNDANGHSAGDTLLKNAAKVLKTAFKETEIFRAGGDEFSIIALDVSEEELAKRIEKIRAISTDYENLSFALGGYIEKDSRNIRMALRLADERMYKDKQQFYENNPDKSVLGRHNRMKFEGAVNNGASIIKTDLDFLTGLMDMNSFFRVSEQRRIAMHEKGIEIALVYFNLSGLKYFNNRYGFAEGDVLIKSMGRILETHFGAENCSRFGQDHFAVFTEKEGLEEKLKAVFREMKKANNGNSLNVRAGIYPDSMGLVETSLACDRAKFACDIEIDENNSYYNYFDNNMLEQEIKKQYVINNIDRAIEENWITAFYQPIVRATNRKVCDEEALVRWIDPERGMLSPADFIPILEETRLIYKVDLHMVDIIIEKIKKQQQAGLHVVPQSVNLSRIDFEMCNVIEEICNRVDSADIARELLTIEITESVIGSDFDYMKEQIERFQKLGFSVWMDDFGSGYSSLNLLQELHFDLIKFDMRFMKLFSSKPESRIILTELMRMAANLNTETVCEGVETEAQVEFLSEIGCTKLQGYYFTKPISFAQILERYERGIQIGFENPAEIEYHSSISSINLYDLGAVSSGETKASGQYFNTQPMLVAEYDGKTLTVIRCNQSYKQFAEKYTAAPKVRQVIAVERIENKVLNTIVKGFNQCEREGQIVFLDDVMSTGDTMHGLLRKVATNPLTEVSSYALAILGITPKNEQKETLERLKQESDTYNRITALIGDFIAMYSVNPENCNYVEYSSNSIYSDLGIPKKGDDFFAEGRAQLDGKIYKEDMEYMLKEFTKEKVLDKAKKGENVILQYRLITGDSYQKVCLRAGIVEEKDGPQLIVGVFKA